MDEPERDEQEAAGPRQGGGGDAAPPGARIAEEFKLLLGVLAERAEPWLNRVASAQEGAEHTPATCGWCPLCAGIAVLRGDRPELAVRAAEHASGLLAVLRASLAERAPAEPRSEPEQAEEPPPERVQKIAIRRRGADNGSGNES